MQYRKFGKSELEVSALGFGTMRFPLQDNGEVDEEEAIRIMRYAIDHGLNYVDTAYPYHQGLSEIIVGKALKDGYREKTYLATKCPVWLLEKEEDFDSFLEEQLHKLDVECIDFYLLHALNKERFEDKVKKLHLIDKMKAAREAGKIKYLGFSFHDEYEVFEEIVDVTEEWDFCQIQYNYINLEYQAGKKGLKYASERGLAVIIMEPLLGGKLANLAPHLAELLKGDKSAVEYALDFLWDQPEVSLVLSGMSDKKQVADNLSYADKSRIGMVPQEDKELYRRAKEVFDKMALVGCTKCAYCMPCPFNLNIPELFAAYNMTASHGESRAKEEYDKLEIKADSCKKCHRCEQECPQNIKISEVMTKVAEIFGNTNTI